MLEQNQASIHVLPSGSFWAWRHCWECPYRQEYKDGWWCNKYNRSEEHDAGCNPDQQYLIYSPSQFGRAFYF